jgi:hypothetical protein
VPYRSEKKRTGSGARKLCRDVHGCFSEGEVSGGYKRNAHRRVDVGTRQMAGRVDHRHDHEAEGRSDSSRAERASSFGVDHDRTAAGEDECEGREALRKAAPRE